MGKEKRKKKMKRERAEAAAEKALETMRLDVQAASGKALQNLRLLSVRLVTVQGEVAKALLDLQVAAASRADSSNLSAETTSSSRSSNMGRCHHLSLDSESPDTAEELLHENKEDMLLLHVDSTKVKELVADSHNPEEKEKAQSRETVHDVAEHMNSLPSIGDCLKLFSHGLTDCNNCSEVAAELPETDGSKNVEHIMASSNVNTTIDGDQTEMSDMKTCPSDFGSLSAESPSRQPYLPDSHHQVTLSEDITSEEVTSGKSCGEKDLTSCSTAHEKTESHEGFQEAALSCLTTDEQTDLLSTQNIQDTSTHKHSSGKQVMYDRAQQVAGKQNKQTATQTRLISKLPPVLTIQLERPASGLPKLSGHVSFKEILQVGPFMDPRSELLETISCKSCSHNEVTHSSLHVLQPEDSPARSNPLQADSTKVKELVADSHNPEEKEQTESSESVHDVAEHMNSLPSIEDCLKLFSHGLTVCKNCSKVASELPETDRTSGKSCGQKDLASCRTANEKAKSHEGVQEAAPSCLTTDEHVLDDHNAQRVEETQNEQTDVDGTASKTELISKLPPVLANQLKRYTPADMDCCIQSEKKSDLLSAQDSPDVTSCLGTENSMDSQVFVKTVSGTTLSVQIDLTKTSTELGQLIEKKAVFSQTEQYLECEGRILKPKLKLSEQGIDRGSTIMIRSRLCGGMVVFTDIPLEDILQSKQIPGRADTELEYTDLGLTTLRGVLRSAIDTIDAGRCWTGTLGLEDFSVDENGMVHPNRAATANAIPRLIRRNLQDLATSIKNHFSVDGKWPAYLENLIKKLRKSTLVWDQAEQRHRLCWVYRLVLLSHFAGLPSMCRANIVYQLKILFDSLDPYQKADFRYALRRCKLNGDWIELVSTDPVVMVTFNKGDYRGMDRTTPFFLSRNYFSHCFYNSWDNNNVLLYDCDSGLEILMSLCLGDYLADLISELFNFFDLYDLLRSCCPGLNL